MSKKSGTNSVKAVRSGKVGRSGKVVADKVQDGPPCGCKCGCWQKERRDALQRFIDIGLESPDVSCWLERINEYAPTPLETDRLVDADYLEQSYALSASDIKDHCARSRKSKFLSVITFPLPLKKDAKRGNLWSLSAIRRWYYNQVAFSWLCIHVGFTAAAEQPNAAQCIDACNKAS